jgi:hypothetical protein
MGNNMSPEVNELSDENILVLKAKFKAVPSNIYGLMILLFNSSKEFETYNVVVSTYSDIYKNELNMDWNEYEEIIVDMKWKGQFNNNLTSSIMDNLNSFQGELDNINLLYDHIYNYNYKELEVVVFDLINRIIHDKNLILETVIQEVTPSDYVNIKEQRSKPKEEEEKSEETGNSAEKASGSVILPIDLILSPVKGKPIYNLKIGDRLMVRIKPTSDRANYLIDDLDLKNEKNIKPVPAEIIDIKAGTQRNDPIEILTKIIPGYFGKSFENEKQVKLRMFDPSVDEEINLKNIKPLEEKTEKTRGKEQGESIMNRGTLVMLVLLLLILLLFAMLIMMNW